MPQKYDPRFIPDSSDSENITIPTRKAKEDQITETEYDSRFIPDEEPVKQPSILNKAWEAANEPLFSIKKLQDTIGSHIGTPEFRAARDIRNEEADKNWPTVKKISDFVGGVVEGLPSTLNLATMGAFSGEGAAAKVALPKVANVLGKTGRALSVPVAAHGAYQTVKPDSTLSERALGLLELGGGALGMTSEPHSISTRETAPNVAETPIRQSEQKLLPAGRFVAGEKGVAAPSEIYPTTKSTEIPYRMDPNADLAAEKFKRTTPNAVDLIGEGSKNVKLKTESPIKEGEVLTQPTTEPSIKKSFISPFEKPSIQEPVEEGPLFARSEKGGIKVGVNIRKAAGELTTGYSNPLEGVMVREGMQNAIDATRHLGENGKINVKVEPQGIEISDNGRGMNRKELETVFSDLHSTGKQTEANATGGKGIGKATYMLGGDHFQVETVVSENGQKIKRTIQGTPEELMEHADVNEEIVPPETPTGTTIKTKFKGGQDTYNANQMLDKIVNHTRGVQAKVTRHQYGFEDSKTFKAGNADQMIHEGNVSGNRVKIVIPEGEELADRGYIDVHYSNNGMYQFTKYHTMEKTPNMPQNLLVDVKPNAEEGTIAYPFPTQRESLKDEIQKEITDIIDNRLTNPQKAARKNRTQELYDSMSSFSSNVKTKRTASILDPGERLTPQELKSFHTSPVVQDMMTHIDSTINSILTHIGNEKWTNRLEGIGLSLDEGSYGIHIPNPTTGKSTILVNPLLHIAMNRDSPLDAALDTVITMLHEVAHIGTDPSTSTAQVTAGELDDPRIGKYLQSYITQVMNHGGIDLGHGFGFVKRLAETYAEFGPKRTFNAADEIGQAITDESGGYSSEVKRLLQLYQDSRGRPETTEDFLSRTGEKSKSRQGPEGNIPGSNRSTRKGTTPRITLESSVNKLFESLEGAKANRVEQDIINRKERAKRFAAFEGVKDEGQAGAAKSMGKLKGQFEKVDTEALNMNQEEVDHLFTAIKGANITSGEKARGYTALFKMLNGDGVPQRNELKLLDDIFGCGW